ncbi:hypothetical protein [Ktedonobacter racemifer]|uniref:Uncharacterized protein n=1 Tax=Ktedonobacter racemifer DSM 44963 TaxID=485913 RepID=D6TVU5_KTERA|nr:hypothetical protein [Ktedonobacter racemifer]EFH84328.1 hypothetical protein Krac_5358 [Ktedonobacter racemifer DSM 44963]
MHDTSTPSLYQRWASRLIKLYPASWRERYADEMLQILEDSPPSLKTICDLSFNLFDAYTHQSLIQGRIPTMLQKLRANELALYTSAIFFFIAWLVEQAHANIVGEQTQMKALFPYNLSTILDPTSPILSKFIAANLYTLPILILLGGLPLLLAACWRALKGKNLRALLLCLLALVSPILAVTIPVAFPFLLYIAGFRGSIPVLDSTWGVLIAFAICMGLSVAFIVSTIKRMEPSRRITHYALYVALVLTVAMLSGFVTLLIATLPTIFNVSTAPGDEMAYAARHILLLLVMVATTGTAIYSLFHAFQAKQSEQIAA